MLTAAEVQSWSWKFIRVVVAVFLGAVCFGVVNDGIFELVWKYNYGWPRRLFYRASDASSRTLVELPMAASANTSITLNLGESVSGDISVALPRQHIGAIQNAIAAIGEHVAWQRVAAHYAPQISIGNRPLRMSELSFALREGDVHGVMRIALRDEPLPQNVERMTVDVRRAPDIVRNATDIRLFTNRVQIITAAGVAASQSEKETLLVSRNNLRFVLLRRREPGSQALVRRRISEIVSKFDSQYVYVVQPLVNAVMFSIPFALLIALLCRLDEEERERKPTQRFAAARYIKLAGTFVVLFLGVGVALGATDLYFGPMGPLRTTLIDTCRRALANPAGAAALGAAFVVWYWPMYVRRTGKGIASTSSQGGRVLLWVLLVLATATCVSAAIATCTSRSLRADLALGAGLLATVFAIASASAEAVGTGRALRDGISTTLFAVVMQAIDATIAPPNLVALVIVAVLLVPLLFSLLHMLAPKWNSWTLFAAALFLSALLVIKPLPSYFERMWWEAHLLRVASELSPGLRLVAAAFLLTLLRHLSKTGNWAILERGERDAGIVLALTFFFLPSHQWLSIIVSFTLGWLILQKWVFVPRNITAEGATDAPATIRDLIRFNEAALALRMMKKDLRGKLAKAELAYHEYERHVRGLEAFVDELRERIEPTGNGAPAAVLSSGNAMEPWVRAVMGAKYGLLFAIPWVALFLRDFHAGFAPESGFAWVAALGTAFQAMGQWPLLGFFFGYFYPHLRGETGLSKGLYLFLAVVTPAFAAAALATPTSAAAWTSFLFWALQLFIHCMMLGFFAGDYETLRASGLGWQHLIDVHNLGALTAWGSTLLIAIAAAATTAATTQAGALIMQALQTVVPELQRAPSR